MGMFSELDGPSYIPIPCCVSPVLSHCMHFKRFIRYNMSEYDAVNFVGDNQAIN